MAYKMVSPSKYPFRRENAKFFSEELIEYVLFDFGHIWKPQRSQREIQLRKVASFVFIPSIGRLVAFISRKCAELVVMRCYRTWNYINSHRPSVRERMLSNEIVSLCVTSELENDLDLFTFMAMVVDYARLVLTHEQEGLIETVVRSLSYCLSEKIPGGFVILLDRMIRQSINFKYPRNYVLCDCQRKTLPAAPAKTDPVYPRRKEFQSPFSVDYVSTPSTSCNTPTEDIVMEVKNREVHKENFRLKMMTDQATQTEIKSSHSVGHLRSVVLKSGQVGFVEKIIIKNNLATTDVGGMYTLIEINDVAVQTWSSTEEQLVKYSTVTSEAERKKTEQMSEGASSLSKHVLDIASVIEKLKALERLEIDDALAGNSCLDLTNIDIKEPDNKGESEAKNLSSSLPTGPSVFQELHADSDKQSFDSDACENRESLSQDLETKCSSEKDTNINASLGDSLFESFDVSTDDPTKIVEEHCSRGKNYSFDSQIGSLDESIRTSDESRLEN